MKGKRIGLKRSLLLLTCLATFAVPLLAKTGGTAFAEPIDAYASGGAYDDLALDLVGATAFNDARNLANADEDETVYDDVFMEHLKTLVYGSKSTRWGNVGVFIGPKGTSENSDVWSVVYSKVSVNNSQINEYDSQTGNAFSKYKAFGGAVQKFNTKAKKSKGSSYAVQKSLDEITAAGAQIANLGTEILEKYNPAPVVLALVDADELSTHPNNELVRMVNQNDNLKQPIVILGSQTGFGVPMSFLIMFFGAFLLLITSVLMTLINGRAAGENIRKMLVKIVIGCVAVPLIAKGLDAGITFLDDVATDVISTPEETYVKQNLNFSDWYACGFSLPSGTSIYINEDGEFVMDGDGIKAINEFTYKEVTGENPTNAKMMERMEACYNLSQALNMGVSFTEPIAEGTQKPWKTTNFYIVMDNFGSNAEDLTDGTTFNSEGSSDTDLANVGYLTSGTLKMTDASSADMEWKVTGSGGHWGISPIAATNLMRTTFTGAAMTVNDNPTIGGVVFNADATAGASSTNMNAFVRFMAMFTIIMAGVRGMFTIFTAGFGGIFSGSVKSAFGTSSGLGQAIGGVIALIGGIFGISVIMSLSYKLLDQMYGLMSGMISGVAAENSLLDPFRELVPDIPILGPIFERILMSVASFVLSILAAITLPKFGGIPITLFCQYMAELPHRMAERAQQIENKFTGDFRGGAGRLGGGGMGSAGSLSNQALNAGKAQGLAMAAGAGTIAGAIGGFAMNKIGGKIAANHGGGDDEDNKNKSMSGEADENQAQDNPEDLQAQADQSVNEAEQAQAAEAAGGEENGGSIDDRDTGGDTNVEGASVAEGNEGDQVNGKEETHDDTRNNEAENHSDTQEGEYSDTQNDQQSEEYGQESSMAVAEQAYDSDSSEVGNTEVSSDVDAYGENSSMSEADTVEDVESREDNLAQVNSRSDHTHEAGPEKSMSRSDGGGGTGGSGNSLGQNSKAHPNAGPASSMNGNPAKKEETKAQKHDRRMRALGKALQAAGGHTTTGQMIAGVTAGAVHMGGGAVGAQNLTQKGINAVRSQRQRQRDIRDGLGPNYSRNQQARQNAQKGRPNNPNAGRQPAQQTVSQRMDAQRRNEAMAEEMARRAEEEEARRR